MANRFLLAFCSLLVAVAVVSGRVSGPLRRPRIVGGFPIDITDTPFLVSVMVDGRHGCGGAIISPDWILTAAHCVEEVKNHELSIRAGSTIKNRGGVVQTVSQSVIHPDWNVDTNEADYALLELSSPLDVNGHTIATIAMPEQDDDDPEEGSRAMLAGWGETEDKYPPNRRLRATFVPIVTRDNCSKAYRNSVRISERMLCAGFYHGGTDSCQGDSGGPLVVDDLLVGVVSFAIGCARPGYPGVNARVASVRDWIREVSDV